MTFHLFIPSFPFSIRADLYGPIPLLPTEGVDYTKSYDELSYPRNISPSANGTTSVANPKGLRVLTREL